MRNVLLAVTDQPLVTVCPRQTATPAPRLPRPPAAEASISSKSFSKRGGYRRAFLEDPDSRGRFPATAGRSGGGDAGHAASANSLRSLSLEEIGDTDGAVDIFSRRPRPKRGRSPLSREVALPDEHLPPDKDRGRLRRCSSLASSEEKEEEEEKEEKEKEEEAKEEGGGVKGEEDYYDCRPRDGCSSSAREDGTVLHPNDGRRYAARSAAINRDATTLGTTRRQEGVHTVSYGGSVCAALGRNVKLDLRSSTKKRYHTRACKRRECRERKETQNLRSPERR